MSVYGNLALRQFTDLDILIDSKNLLKAKALLLSQEYSLTGELSWESNFISRNHQINVDLHWGLTPLNFPFLLNFEGLWQQAKPIFLMNNTVVNLSPEDLLIILCVQVVKNVFEKRIELLKISDVAQLIHTYQTFNWQKVMQQARARSIERLLFLNLFLVDDLLGNVLPIEVQEELKKKMLNDPIIKLYANRVHKQFLFNNYNLSQDKNTFLIFFDHLTLIFLARLLIEPSPKKGLYPGYFAWQFIRLVI